MGMLSIEANKRFLVDRVIKDATKDADGLFVKYDDLNYKNKTLERENKELKETNQYLEKVNTQHVEKIEALKKELPRKNSKEYNEAVKGDSSYPDKWDSANRAKKDARSVAHTYFDRIVKYAFPKAKEESEAEGSAVSDTTKDIEQLNTLIKRLEKAESRPYDLAQVINNLKVTLALIHE